MMNLQWLPKDFRKNLTALYGVNTANFIIPWISVPYLVRVIGPENYGLLAFAAAVVQYCTVISDYGYNFTGSREISLVRDDLKKLSELASSILWTRLLLAIGVFGIISLLCLFVPLLQANILLITLSFGSVLGGIFIQAFLLQGVEKFQILSRLMLLSKILATISIFIFIKEKQDILIVPVIYSIGQLIAGASSIVIAIQQFGVRYSLPDYKKIVYQLRAGWRVFLTSGVINIFTSANTIILSAFTIPEVVGWYAAGERIVRAIQGLVTPVYTVTYPHVVRLKQESKEKALRFMRKLLLPLVSITSVGTIILLLWPETIVNIILGSQFKGTIDVLRIMSIVPILFSCTLVSANLFLLGCGYEQRWSRIVIGSGIVGVLISLSLVGGLNLRHIGAGIAIVVGETLVMIGSMKYFIKECQELKKL